MYSTITYRPVGYIHSPFKSPAQMPIQPSSHQASPGTVEVHPEFAEALVDLEGFSHLILLYHFHAASGAALTVTPFLDDQPHGVFATRAPVRPNSIGLSLISC